MNFYWPCPVPYVWSPAGHEAVAGIDPQLSVQSNLSSVSCTNPQVCVSSKSQYAEKVLNKYRFQQS